MEVFVNTKNACEKSPNFKFFGVAQRQFNSCMNCYASFVSGRFLKVRYENSGNFSNTFVI